MGVRKDCVVSSWAVGSVVGWVGWGSGPMQLVTLHYSQGPPLPTLPPLVPVCKLRKPTDYLLGPACRLCSLPRIEPFKQPPWGGALPALPSGVASK